MGETDRLQQQQPQAKAPDPVPRKTERKPAAQSSKHLDVTKLTQLLLRDAAHFARTALGTTGPNRLAMLTAAVGRVGSITASILNAARDTEVSWNTLVNDVAGFVAVVRSLEKALDAQKLPELGHEVRGSLALLAKDVMDMELGKPPDDVIELLLHTQEIKNAPEVVALDSGDQVALVHQGLAGARAAIRSVIDAKEANDHGEIVLRCVPIPQHLTVANDAALGITNRRERLKLTPDVEGISSDLERLAQFLAATPKHAWDTVFAQTFDTENQLRRALGLTARARPYSGTVDPQKALAILKSIDEKKTKNEDYTTMAAVDPQTAINAIAVGVRHVYKEQERSMADVEGKLREPPPPKTTSLLDDFLNLAASMVLGGVAGMLAGAFADKLKRSLEKSAGSRAGRLAEEISLATATSETRGEIMTRLVRDGALYRAVAVDGAKDAAKTLFKDSVNMALKAKKANAPDMSQPLNAFFAHQRAVLGETSHQAELKLVHFAPALVQLDLDTLNELSRFINDELHKQAHALHYDTVMREWQNFKARLDMHDAHGNVIPYKPAEGVLEVNVVLDAQSPLGHARPKGMTLRGGEKAAIDHLKKERRTLDKVGLHADIKAKFENADGHFGGLTLSLGPDFRLRSPESLDMSIVKLIASKQPVNAVTVTLAFSGEYDKVPDSVALQTGRQLVQNVAWMTTLWLESD